MSTPNVTTAQDSGELLPCQCKDYADAQTGERLECDRDTYRNFAPGHDARLKGFLIRVGRAGHKVKVMGSDEVVTPVKAASRYGFAEMVQDGVRRPEKRPARPFAPGRRERPSETPQTARVGRWEYRGRLRRYGDHQEFVYRDRKGNERRTPAYELIKA